MIGALEWRSAGELRVASLGRLAGYAAVFDAPSRDLGGFVEVIRAGAFRRTLRDAEHVRALYDHDSKQVLGRVGAKTLRVEEDARGLRFELDLPQTTYAKDVATLVERGDVAGASFAFRVAPGGERWQQSAQGVLRELLDVDLGEITITANPAYPDTSVAKRSLQSWLSKPDRTLRRLYLDTL